MILGLDTSAAQCAVALLGEGAPVTERLPMERGHAEHLFPMIEAVLATAGAGYRDIARVAVCTGPGSFTGVRIGVAAARGLALGLGVPAVGVSRFEALAYEAGGPVAVCLAGRGGSVFLQVFDAAGAALTEPALTTVDGLAAAIPSVVARFAGDAAPLLAGAAALVPSGLPDPAVVARLAGSRPAGSLPAPLYLRGADAELPRDRPPPLLD
jgi:tRNA threonylcarbamoyl adenosine modification protein YeaZ